MHILCKTVVFSYFLMSVSCHHFYVLRASVLVAIPGCRGNIACAQHWYDIHSAGSCTGKEGTPSMGAQGVGPNGQATVRGSRIEVKLSLCIDQLQKRDLKQRWYGRVWITDKTQP